MKRLFIALGIGLYLTAHAAVLWLNVIGDVHRHQVVYFFTWDMFPFSVETSVRHVAIGTTRRGQHWQLVPNPTLRFRGGVRGNLNRADLDRAAVHLRPLVDRALQVYQPRMTDDPIERVTLLEQSWPRRLNLPDGTYEQWAGEPKRDVRYWRTLDSLSTSRKGTVVGLVHGQTGTFRARSTLSRDQLSQ